MRTRIYELPNGRFVVIWEARRNFPTREEALAAARQELPTAPKGPLRVAPGIVELAAKLHDEARWSWRAIAAALDETKVPTALGTGRWSSSTLRGAVKRAKAERAEKDRLAVHGEWNLTAE